MRATPSGERGGRGEAEEEPTPPRNGPRARSTRSSADPSDPSPDRGREGLQLESDPAFQRGMWTIQRVGWGVMLGVMVAALLGLLGRGPLSRTYKVHPDSPLAIEYERFGRASSPDRLRVYLLPGSSRGGEARLAIGREFFESVEEVEVEPTPLRVEAGGGWLRYRFAATEPARPTVVSLRYKPNRAGGITGRVALDGHAPFRFSQYVFP